MAISFPATAFLLVSTKDARHFDPTDLKCARALGTRLGRMTERTNISCNWIPRKKRLCHPGYMAGGNSIGRLLTL